MSWVLPLAHVPLVYHRQAAALFPVVVAQACSHILQVRRDELALLEHVLKPCQRDDAAVSADRCVTCPSLPPAQVNRDQLALLEFVLKSCYREDSALMGRRYCWLVL